MEIGEWAEPWRALLAGSIPPDGNWLVVEQITVKMARVQSLSRVNAPSTAVFQSHHCSTSTTTAAECALSPVVMQSFANIESLIGLTSDRTADRPTSFPDLALFQPPPNLAQSSSIDVVDNFSQARSASSAQHANDANKVDFASSANHSINNSNGTQCTRLRL